MRRMLRLLGMIPPPPDPDKDRVRREQWEVEARLRVLEILADPRGQKGGGG